MPEFFLGAHRPPWLESSPVPLFVSHSTLGKRKKLPRARVRWALDSGAFTEVSKHGRHRMSAKDYAARVKVYQRDIGQLFFAAPQDWMCEPPVIKRTGLSVREHQKRTIQNFLELREHAPEVPWMPVLQGWGMGDYFDHYEAYARAGVDLRKAQRVGVGSICRRQGSIRISMILSELKAEGLKLHGFGLKVKGFELARECLASADSMAWSVHERKEHREKRLWDPSLPKTGRQNEIEAALEWLEYVLEPAMTRGAQYPELRAA